MSQQQPYDSTDLSSWAAWLFDLDGVLTKTADVHAAAWQQAFDDFLDREEEASPGETFARFNPVDDYRRYVDGQSRCDGVRNFAASRNIDLPEGNDDDPSEARTVNGVGKAKNELVLELFATRGVTVYDGAVALVEHLRSSGTKIAVVSASQNTRAVLDAAGISRLFDVRIDGHTVVECGLAGKPAPDSYLEAAKRLQVKPSRAVVVEDALAGVAAGRSGSFGLVIGVDHYHQADELLAQGADLVVTDLAELVQRSRKPEGEPL